MNTGFFGLPWFAWAGISLAVSLLYSFVWPRRRISENGGFRYLVLRWGHTLVWVLLAINFLLRGLSPSAASAADAFALSGGLAYLLFLVMTFSTKK